MFRVAGRVPRLRAGSVTKVAPAATHEAVAIFWIPMATYRELLQQVREQIEEIGISDAAQLLEGDDRPLVVDVRERHEWDEGRLPNAVHIPRGSLESRIERAAPDRSTPILVYCATGARSAFATKSLEEMGYEHVTNLDGGITEWKRSGLPVVVSESLAPAQRTRYSRHLLIPEVGEEGQLRLLDARILLIGAGRTRLTRGPLPRGRRRRDARHRRRRRCRRDESPAPDRPLDGPAGRAEGRVGQADDRGAEPRRDRAGVP